MPGWSWNRAEQLPSLVEQGSRRLAKSAHVGRTLADVERELILDTLDYCFGNRTRAAKILEISVRTLRNKLAEYAASGIPIAYPIRTRRSAPEEE